MRQQTFHVQGGRFTAWVAGDGPRLALLLHGFPDDPGSLAQLMTRLADHGFTAVAPYLRGYGRSDGRDGDYCLARLAADAVGLIEAAGFDTAVVVGHDWGALIGYAAANLAPSRISHLVALSVPPPRALVRGLRETPAQLARSWYIGFFQLPLIPERALVRRNYALIDRLWTDWSPGWSPPAERLAEIKRTFDYPGTVKAALGYYRALLPRGPGYRRSWRLALGRIAVPSLVLYGDRDGCLGAELYQDLDGCFLGPYRARMLRGGHWLPLEDPDTVHEEIRALLARAPLPAPPRAPRRLPVVSSGE
jgi:pimeloyl-ACP methyl ester carboxylesterase